VLRRLLVWGVVLAVLAAAALAVTSFVLLRPESLRRTAADALSRHLNMDVAIAHLEVTFYPRPRASGSGLSIRVPKRPDLPPFIAIEHFRVDVGLLTALRKHVGTVHVDGLRIAVPPGGSRPDLPAGVEASAEDAASTDEHAGVIVDRLVAHDAELAFIPRTSEKPPLTFRIHDLALDNISFSRPIPFYAKLTNPVPTGLVETRGTFGPWRRDDPTSTPLAGDYTFTNADLSTINGIGGILSSTGSYTGHLTEIAAKGTTETPDFSLDLGGRPLPLTATYEAIVNGTNGSTELVRVDARLLNTPIRTSGKITNLSGPGRHDIDLHITIEDGRIEDILALAIDSPTPMLVGDLSLESTFALPPGPTRVPRRLEMAGRFGLSSAKFSDGDVQRKLQELSRRSQGKTKDEAMGRVLTDLRGRFTVRRGTLHLPDLRFRVPGATVALAGRYGLERGAIDFRGELRMQATVSRAVGGIKSFFLKPFDALFRKDGAGAVVPIKITGTQKAPKMSLEVGRIFGRGK
jgi:hypothetical protein